MKCACIYFPISSVGGIATETRAYKLAAEAAGDTFNILRCPVGPGIKQPILFNKPKSIRGGDTHITIDGELSHHPKRVGESIRWLNKNYDMVFMINGVPRPNKAYGTEPHFIKLFEGLKIPIHMHITDGYISTYPWIKGVLTEVQASSIVTPAYRLSAEAIGVQRLSLLALPFFPDEFPGLDEPACSPQAGKGERLIIWPSQWKDIKGIKPFLNQLKHIAGVTANVELYSCGIRYYQLRTTPEWNAAVAKDLFKGYGGEGHAIYYGEVGSEAINAAMVRAWGSVNLQGLSTRGRHPAYREGSYNFTEVEALWWGAWPIVADQVHKSAIPDECCQFVTQEDASDLPGIIENLDAPLRDYPEWGIAREFVEERHSASTLWDQVKGSVE